MSTKDQQEMGSGDPLQNSGAVGSKGRKNMFDVGGEHGEKKPANADHDRKIAENRRRLLDQEHDVASGSPEHSTRSKMNSTADDTLGQTEGRRPTTDADRERNSGDIVSGNDPRNPTSAVDGSPDLRSLDKGRNDDLSMLDKDGSEPMK